MALARKLAGWGCLFTLQAVLSLAAYATSASPNIVLIVGDDHGYPDYGFTGSDIAHTPNLDRLAEEGLVYTHAFAPVSLCRPALQTLLAGIHPREWVARHDALETLLGPIPRRREVRYFHDTLPRLLAQAGYRTFQAGKHWEGTFADAGYHSGTQQVVATITQGPDFGRPSIAAMEAFLADVEDEPFFLFLAPMLPHLPFDAPERFEAPYSELGLSPPELGYFANVTRLDEVVGQIIAALEAHPDTIILYLADNGWDPVLAPEDPLAILTGGDRGKNTPYELGLRTPLILHGLRTRGTSRALVSFEDVHATILSLAGVEQPEDHRGQDVRARPRRAIAGAMDRIRWPIGEWTSGAPFSSTESVVFCRSRRWRYIHWRDRGEQALFRIRKDPFEQRDVSSQWPRVVRRMARCVKRWEAQLSP